MGTLHVIFSRFCTFLKRDSFRSFANTKNFQLEILIIRVNSQH